MLRPPPSDGASVDELQAERQAAAVDALRTERRQRAVGVRYVKATEATSHYVQASLTAQFDAWIHVDRSAALTPLP